MSLPYATRRALDQLATTLRQWADASQQTSWSGPDDHQPTSYWTGRADAFMEAHGLIMAALTADMPPICVGDEITVQWPGQVEGLPLTNTDAHFDVLEVRDGMVGFARTINRGRPCASYVNHWAPVTAVKRVSDGHRCPDEPSQASAPEGGA